MRYFFLIALVSLTHSLTHSLMDVPNNFEWGFPKTKNRASNRTLYDTSSRFASNCSVKCGSKCLTFAWTLTYHPRCIYIQVNMILQLIVAEI